MAFAQAAFLPTATEAVIEETPPSHRGFAMALFSQCFAVSAIVAPLVGGALLDLQGNGLLLWMIMATACLVMLPALGRLQPRYSADGHAADVCPISNDLIDAVTRVQAIFGCGTSVSIDQPVTTKRSFRSIAGPPPTPHWNPVRDENELRSWPESKAADVG